MKTLIIHHLQEMWDTGLRKYGTSFEDELQKVCEHLEENDYDNVIVSNFEGHLLEEEQLTLNHYCFPIIQDYMYGWERQEIEATEEQKETLDDGEIIVDNYGTKWALGGHHSEVVILPEWMEEIEGEIFICGAFDGECIEDLEIALGALNKDFNRIENLIT